MAQYNIDEINAKLSKSNEKFDSMGGFIVLLAGISKRLPAIYGENTARNFTFQLGSAPGAEIADKILESRGGKIYEDPIKATIGLFQRLPHYYRIKIEEIQDEDSGVPKIIFQLTSYLDSIYEKRTDVKRGEFLCQINRGYLMTALEKLTQMRVKFDHLDIDPDFCKICLEFQDIN